MGFHTYLIGWLNTTSVCLSSLPGNKAYQDFVTVKNFSVKLRYIPGLIIALLSQ